MIDKADTWPDAWTAEERAAGLAMYTGKIMVWPSAGATVFVPGDEGPALVPGGDSPAVLFTRSPGWRALRLDWVRTHPKCMACGGRAELEVHHKVPFHIKPELELDRSNLITLCTGSRGINCHFIFGHGLNWTRYVENVDGLAAAYWTSLVHLLPEKSDEEMTRDLLAAVERLGATRIK